MRSLKMIWRNGKGGKWTVRIRWLEGDGSIRLEETDVNWGKRDFIFTDPAAARAEWERFRREQTVKRD